jgi:hypothetical protein
LREADLQKWKCHKVVEAFKITSISTWDDARESHLLTGGGESVIVPNSYFQRNPFPIGGYYVLYRDDYESWSPASEFEAGYTKFDGRPWWKRIFG